MVRSTNPATVRHQGSTALSADRVICKCQANPCANGSRAFSINYQPMIVSSAATAPSLPAVRSYPLCTPLPRCSHERDLCVDASGLSEPQHRGASCKVHSEVHLFQASESNWISDFCSSAVLSARYGASTGRRASSKRSVPLTCRGPSRDEFCTQAGTPPASTAHLYGTASGAHAQQPRGQPQLVDFLAAQPTHVAHAEADRTQVPFPVSELCLHRREDQLQPRRRLPGGGQRQRDL